MALLRFQLIGPLLDSSMSAASKACSRNGDVEIQTALYLPINENFMKL